jgi:ribulose-phosphate 3-epimerase
MIGETGKIKLSPSMMCADFLEMKRDLDLFEEYGIDFLHIDIMDGHYVPNFALGTDFCRHLRKYSPILLDIHLMVEDVDRHIEAFCRFENALLSFHPETARHPVRTIETIQSHACKAGIALDSAIGIDRYRELYPLVDFVLVMTVTPGYAGQQLLPFCLEKIRQLRNYFAQNNIPASIEADGNVSWENIPPLVKAGADILVNGSSSIFDSRYSRKDAIEKLRKII